MGFRHARESREAAADCENVGVRFHEGAQSTPEQSSCQRIVCDGGNISSRDEGDA
jgi:hypothetical protein